MSRLQEGNPVDDDLTSKSRQNQPVLSQFYQLKDAVEHHTKQGKAKDAQLQKRPKTAAKVNQVGSNLMAAKGSDFQTEGQSKINRHRKSNSMNYGKNVVPGQKQAVQSSSRGQVAVQKLAQNTGDGLDGEALIFKTFNAGQGSAITLTGSTQKPMSSKKQW